MQVWPQVQSEAGNRLTRVLQEKALIIANTFFQQSKGRLYTWTLQKGQHWNQIDYIPCSQRWRSSIQSAKIRHGPVCGSDNQLLNAKYRLKLKKVGKTTRQFRYQFSSVAQLCLTQRGPMDCSMPVLPVHHQLPELTQTHVHRVSYARQPPHPVSSPSPPDFNLSQHEGLFQWVSYLHQVAQVLEFQLQHHSFQWTLRTDFL